MKILNIGEKWMNIKQRLYEDRKAQLINKNNRRKLNVLNKNVAYHPHKKMKM